MKKNSGKIINRPKKTIGIMVKPHPTPNSSIPYSLPRLHPI